MPPKGGNSAVKKGKGRGQKRSNIDPTQPNIMSFFAAPEPTLRSPIATAAHDEKALGNTTTWISCAVVDLTHNNAANASIKGSSGDPCGATSIDSATISGSQFAGVGGRNKQPKATAATSGAVALGTGGGGSVTASENRNVFRRASELVKQAPTAGRMSIPRASERVEDDSPGGMPPGKCRKGGFVQASEVSRHEQVSNIPAASMPRTTSVAPNVSATTSSSSASQEHLARASSEHSSAFGSGATTTSTTPARVAVETEKVTRRSTGATGSKTNTLSSWGSLGETSRACGKSTPRGTNQQRRPPRDHHRPVHLPFHVVGLQFREAVDAPSTGARQHLKPNTTLGLEREPCNIHDENAVKVLLPPSLGSTFVGYIPARVAVLLAPFLDAAPGTVARATVRAIGAGEEEGGAKGEGAVVGVGRQTLPAVLELQPLDGVNVEPFRGLMVKLREAAKKEEKRGQKRKSEVNAHKERLRSRQRSLLLDFGRSGTEDGSAARRTGLDLGSSSERGGGMLESLPREVLWQVFCSPGISSRELFGPIRAVCSRWLQAVDDLPCAAARRAVALVCAGQAHDPAGANIINSPSHSLGTRSGGDGGGGHDGVIHQSESAPAFSQRGGSSNGVFGEGSSGESAGAAEERPRAAASGGRDDWWKLVRARLVEGGGFAECDAEDVLGRLEWAAVQETLDLGGDNDDDGGGGGGREAPVSGARSHVGGLAHAAGIGDGGGGGGRAGGRAAGGGEESSPRGRIERILGHLAATRALCAIWGLVAVRDETGGGDVVSGRRGGTAGRGRSWSGWEALALAAVTSSSEDRLSLCLWAIRPVMESDDTAGSDREGWCPGLPRGQVIELLCMVLCALRSLKGPGPPWLGMAAGSTRLDGDLLACARVLENWDMRFQKPGQPATDFGSTGGAGGGSASRIMSNLTAEQRSIVLADVKPGEVLTVQAFAGTGKTTCLRAYAQARPHLRILYLTFNVSVREEAIKTFPPNASCKGVHQLAFAHKGRKFQGKISSDLKEADVQSFLRKRLGHKVKLAAASLVLSTLSCFLSSADPMLSLDHVKRRPQAAAASAAANGIPPVAVDSDDEEGVAKAGMASSASPRPSGDGTRSSSLPSPPPPREQARRGQPDVEEATVLDWARTCWGAMQAARKPRGGGGRGGDGETDDEGWLGMTHAGYLKLFQLSRPCLSRSYDVIMLDEAQDSNPCIANIVLRETACARILVGDSHQAIYGFIGAEDHLKLVSGGKIRHLTQVFRFGQSIAHVANVLVGCFKGETRPLLGCARNTGEVVFGNSTGLAVVRNQDRLVAPHIAFLARSVTTLVYAAIIAVGKGKKVAWVGGAQAYNLDTIEDMCLMAMGRSGEVRNPLLKRLKSIRALIRFTQQSGDRQWSSRLRTLEGEDPERLLSELRNLQQRQVHPRDADIILSTVHKAKGLEFDTVVLADDLIDVATCPWTTGPTSKPVVSQDSLEEINILYVAITRAKRRLIVNASLVSFFYITGAWDSLYLRGISRRLEGKRSGESQPPLSPLPPPRCVLCLCPTFVGGGGARADRVDKQEVVAAGSQLAAQNAQLLTAAGQGDRGSTGSAFSHCSGGSNDDRDCVKEVGLLYAESASLRALCCWCVEGSRGRSGGGGGGGSDPRVPPDTAAPTHAHFHYAKALVRGLTEQAATR